MAKRNAQFKSEVFSAKEMRGLSKAEKEFIAKNNFFKYIVIKDILGRPVSWYMGIGTDFLGKKKLYAYNFKQMANPNCKIHGHWGYEVRYVLCRDGFSQFAYEYHFNGKCFRQILWH